MSATQESIKTPMQGHCTVVIAAGAHMLVIRVYVRHVHVGSLLGYLAQHKLRSKSKQCSKSDGSVTPQKSSLE